MATFTPAILYPCPACGGSGYAPEEVRKSPAHYICGPCVGSGSVMVNRDTQRLLVLLRGCSSRGEAQGIYDAAKVPDSDLEVMKTYIDGHWGGGDG